MLAACAVLICCGIVPSPVCGVTIYVDGQVGDDQNDGQLPSSPTRTIGRAALIASPGDNVRVAPGTYTEGNLSPAAFGRIGFIADRSSGADVVVDARGFDAGFDLTGKLAVTVDGFVVYGAAVGIYVKSGSDQCVVVNNVVSANSDKGIYVQDSDNVLVFNNLVYNNAASGILVSGNVDGSRGVKVINNTVYANGNRGIFFSGSTIPSSDGLLFNNIAEGNANGEIQVNDVSRPGHRNAGNVTLGRVASGTPRDATDIREDALFVDPDGADGVLGGEGYADDDFHLQQMESGDLAQSPAVDAGAASAADFGLAGASTRTDEQPDGGLVDAGYHYDNVGAGKIPDLDALRFVGLYVDPETGDDERDASSSAQAVRSLARAVTLAGPGNDIRLAAGTYREGDIEIVDLNLGGRELRITGSGVARIEATGHGRALLVQRNSRVALSGVEITGATVAGVQVRHRSEIRAQDCSIVGNAEHGLWVLEDSNAWLSNVTVADNAEIGVYSIDAAIMIDKGTVAGNGDDGLRVIRGSLHATDTLVSGNGNGGVFAFGADSLTWVRGRVDGNSGNGLQVSQGESIAIEGGEFSGNGGDGITIGTGIVQMSNVRVRNNGSSGVLATNAPVTVQAGRFENNGDEGIRLAGGSLEASDVSVLGNGREGVDLDGSARLVWQGGEVAGNVSNGIQVSGAESLSITGTRVQSNGGDGITLTDAGSGRIADIYVGHNGSSGVLAINTALTVETGTFQGNGTEGISVKGGSVDASDSTALQNGREGVVAIGASRFVWEGGRVADNIANGLQAMNVNTVSIANAIVHTNRGDGLTLYDGAGAQVWNSLVYGNGSSGILISGQISGSPGAQVLNCTVYGNVNRGLVIGGSTASSASPGAIVQRNVFAANGVAGINVLQNSVAAYDGDFNISADPYGPFTTVGFHDVIDDPLLLDPAGADGILGGVGWADDRFLLRQFAAGQDSQSAAVDAGGIMASAAGLADLTTRSDRVNDQGMVDLGFHYAVLTNAVVGCSGDAQMEVADLVLGINIALGLTDLEACPTFDRNDDGRITVEEIVYATGLLLNGRG